VPISVIGGDRIDRDRAFTVADLTQIAPGLTATTPNARRSGIRGIGKASGNDNMEAAVGIIVDDVFLGHVGMSYQDFTDLERVEVLRGPQGTLLGKNTTLGVIKYTSRAPSSRRNARSTSRSAMSRTLASSAARSPTRSWTMCSRTERRSCTKSRTATS